jgi:molybdopterin/thiamine biosynthesis adenylyltransferase
VNRNKVTLQIWEAMLQHVKLDGFKVGKEELQADLMNGTFRFTIFAYKSGQLFAFSLTVGSQLRSIYTENDFHVAPCCITPCIQS